MNLQAAVNLANEKIQEHLPNMGWTFQLDNSVKQFGVCRYCTRVISMSRHLIQLNNEEQVLDTILHEIAHALTPRAHHGYEWKMACIRIGAKPERCYTTETVNTPTLRYQATCGNCNKTYGRAKRVNNAQKRSCTCQRGISWSERHLLVYVDTSMNIR
jgi:predicted SprT family Zn-dependent metalloprotease